MPQISPEDLLAALLKAGAQAAFENFQLADDFDMPVFPESIVQVEVAKSLRTSFRFEQVELEATTGRLAQAMSGRAPAHAAFPSIDRPGEVDVVCWEAFGPQVLVEVKDQINGTDDGLREDLVRLQQFLDIVHKWAKPGDVWPKWPVYGALVFFVGKNAAQYKKDRYLAAHFLPFADRTVDTAVTKLEALVDKTKFKLIFDKRRVVDSAKDGPPPPDTIGTEFEETVSGKEQFTYCVACVLHRLP